jgi:Serine kinase of the HPr protein, regulates carbohydrate metabolism
METDDRMLCGWRVRSELALPDLPPWEGDDRDPDLNVRLGSVPERLEDEVVSQPLLQMARDGTCRFALAGVAAYRIDAGGGEIVVDPVMDRSAPDIRVFLLGTVLGIVCFRRGLFPLHASCVRLGGVAVAFAAPSGSGKSTLAATLLRRGHALLADDVTVIATAAGGPVVLPAIPRLKLEPSVAQRLGFPVEGVERSWRAVEKCHVPVGSAFSSKTLPLAAVYHLETVNDARHESLVQVGGMSAVTMLHRSLYRLGLAARLGLDRATFLHAGHLAAHGLAQYRLGRRLDFDALEAIADDIVRRHQPAVVTGGK